MTANPDFKKKFSSKLELPVFINDELVTFGQTYAKRMDTNWMKWESLHCTAVSM